MSGMPHLHCCCWFALQPSTSGLIAGSERPFGRRHVESKAAQSNISFGPAVRGGFGHDIGQETKAEPVFSGFEE